MARLNPDVEASPKVHYLDDRRMVLEVPLQGTNPLWLQLFKAFDEVNQRDIDAADGYVYVSVAVSGKGVRDALDRVMALVERANEQERKLRDVGDSVEAEAAGWFDNHRPHAPD